MANLENQGEQTVEGQSRLLAVDNLSQTAKTRKNAEKNNRKRKKAQKNDKIRKILSTKLEMRNRETANPRVSAQFAVPFERRKAIDERPVFCVQRTASGSAKA